MVGWSIPGSGNSISKSLVVETSPLEGQERRLGCLEQMRVTQDDWRGKYSSGYGRPLSVRPC